MNKLYSLAINPWIILASLGAGAALGLNFPAQAAKLAFVGDVYVDMLKMIVLPFMVSAVIFSLQKVLRHGGAGQMLMRTFAFFAAALAVVAVLGIATGVVAHGRGGADASKVETYGNIVGKDVAANDTSVELNGEVKDTKASFADTLRASLVPTNVFAALAQGETLKALVFALLFGVAVGTVRGGVADGLARGLEAIYQACQRLTGWLNYPLPLVLLCMSAGQLAKTGLAPLAAMTDFIVAFTVASLLVLALSVAVLWRRSGQTLGLTLQSLRAPFALALATRSSATCMPSMIDALSQQLRFPRERVELLVPLSISLLRIGPVLYYVCATMFIAHLYGHKLSVGDLALVGSASILAGCASAGMSGLVTVSLTGMVCSYIGLPFEAAFVLFLAVDPVCDMLRTVVLVVGNSAAVAAICPAPERLQAAADALPLATASTTASDDPGAPAPGWMRPPELAAQVVAQAARTKELV
jgi:Na+/H+-dicarboxylate symporter